MGRVIVAGAGRMTVPSTEVFASDLTVGTVVKLMESGTAVEYIVVNQGVPSNSNLYNSSCNGTWLLRKDIHSKRAWDSGSGDDAYKTSTINTWLNGDFFNSLGSIEQSTIKQVQIPYYSLSLGNPIFNLTCKVFLLGGYELGWTTRDYGFFPVDGAKLDYFESGTETSANNKRIANLNGSADFWWLRSPNTDNTSDVWCILNNGHCNGRYGASSSYGIRPALILPSTAKFDAATMLLKG